MNATLASLTRKIVRVPDSTPQPAVAIDEAQRLIVSGKPMFPIGLQVTPPILRAPIAVSMAVQYVADSF